MYHISHGRISSSTSQTWALITAFFIAFGCSAQTTTLWLEEFDGGMSTTGFTVDQDSTDCYWLYAPDSVHADGTFNQDFSGVWPAGPGFDSSFVFLDSDECGVSGVYVNNYLTSAAFDASDVGNYTLYFAHQFRSRLSSFIHVDAFNGTDWTEVYHHTGSDVGYPNPAQVDTVDITAATGGSADARVRFQFHAGWDWWWALDSISVTYMSTIGIEELAQQGMRVFPSPANEILNVQFRTNKATRLRVYNSMGAQVLDHARTAALPVVKLSPGAYVLVAVDANGHDVGRVRFLKE